MDRFKIDVTRFWWVKDDGRDDPEDLCLHGHVTAQFGDFSVEDDCTVSATALRLLQTLTENHHYQGDNEQMLPCCGHFMIASDDLQSVYIDGCSNGTDWSVLHENEWIKIVLKDGATFFIDPVAYREEVFRFADKVKAFYDSCLPKTPLREDPFIQDGYTAFWNEWNRRRSPYDLANTPS